VPLSKIVIFFIQSILATFIFFLAIKFSNRIKQVVFQFGGSVIDIPSLLQVDSVAEWVRNGVRVITIA